MIWLYKIQGWIISRAEMLERMLFWAWKLRWNFDFDADTLYEIQYLKLKRVYQCMLNHGHLEWNKNANTKHMRRLAEAVELARVLYQGHPDKHMDRFQSKYASAVSNDWLTQHFRERYPEAKEVPEEQYSFYLHKAAERDQADFNILKARFYTLLAKYQGHWWD